MSERRSILGAAARARAKMATKGVARTYLIPFIKYVGTAIVPLFVGSYFLAGGLAKYSNHETMNKAIMESEYKPAKEKFRECHRVHNRLFLAEQEQAGTFLALKDEFEFLRENGGHPLGREYPFFIEGLLKQQQATQDEATRLRSELTGCYDALYSYFDDLGLLLGQSDKFAAISTARAKEFNELEMTRSAASNRVLRGSNVSMLKTIFRRGFEEFITTKPEAAVRGFRLLADQAQALSAADKAVFDMETRYYEQTASVVNGEIRTRLDKGIWAFLLD